MWFSIVKEGFPAMCSSCHASMKINSSYMRSGGALRKLSLVKEEYEEKEAAIAAIMARKNGL